VSMMKTMDLIIKDLEYKASVSLAANEKLEEISSALFEELFNYLDRDNELMNWAMAQVSQIMERVTSGQKSNDLVPIKNILNEILTLLWTTKEKQNLNIPDFILAKMIYADNLINGGVGELGEDGTASGCSDPTVGH